MLSVLDERAARDLCVCLGFLTLVSDRHVASHLQRNRQPLFSQGVCSRDRSPLSQTTAGPVATLARWISKPVSHQIVTSDHPQTGALFRRAGRNPTPTFP